jgi:hypothetical protein
MPSALPAPEFLAAATLYVLAGLIVGRAQRGLSGPSLHLEELGTQVRVFRTGRLAGWLYWLWTLPAAATLLFIYSRTEGLELFPLSVAPIEWMIVGLVLVGGVAFPMVTGLRVTVIDLDARVVRDRGRSVPFADIEAIVIHRELRAVGKFGSTLAGTARAGLAGGGFLELIDAPHHTQLRDSPLRLSVMLGVPLVDPPLVE